MFWKGQWEMSAEGDNAMMDYHLSSDEVRELRAELDAGEWEALLAVQRELLDAPALSPSDGFVNRTLAQLAAREQMQMTRRNLIGSFLFMLGTSSLLALSIWLSPLRGFAQIDGWAGLLSNVLYLWASVSALITLGSALAQAVFDVTGEWLLLALGCVAFALTLVWVRVIGPTDPLNRPHNATEA